MLTSYMKAIMKALGAKGIKIQKFKRKIVTAGEDKSEDGDLPMISDILKMSGGKK